MSSAAAKNSDEKKVPTDKSAIVMLFIIAADTTWRMFVPIIGGTIVGVTADNMLKSKPLATIVMVIVGVAVATVLVRNQLKRNVNAK